MKRANAPTISTDSLPKGVRKSDTEYDFKVGLKRDPNNPYLPTILTFYLVKSLRRADLWVMTTLSINSKGRAYGIGIEDEKMYRVGQGPHVVKTVKVYLNNQNLERLQKYVDLYMKGAENANMLRDQRSTRIMRTKLRKAQLASWMS